MKPRLTCVAKANPWIYIFSSLHHVPSSGIMEVYNHAWFCTVPGMGSGLLYVKWALCELSHILSPGCRTSLDAVEMFWYPRLLKVDG